MVSVRLPSISFLFIVSRSSYYSSLFVRLTCWLTSFRLVTPMHSAFESLHCQGISRYSQIRTRHRHGSDECQHTKHRCSYLLRLHARSAATLPPDSCSYNFGISIRLVEEQWTTNNERRMADGEGKADREKRQVSATPKVATALALVDTSLYTFFYSSPLSVRISFHSNFCKIGWAAKTTVSAAKFASTTIWH